MKMTVYKHFLPKVNQSVSTSPVVVPQTTSLTATPRPVQKNGRVRGSGAARQGSRRRRGKKGGKGRKKKKGRRRKKKKKGRRRGHRRRHRLDAARNSTRTKGKRKRKNPHLPFRVPTALPPTAVNTTSGGPLRAGGTNSSDPDSETRALPEGEEEEELSSSEMSLPKYLRHRGRRQLGEGGGIIQAPLLSACKPGAKRDYNYKCRPKFIPQGRDRRRVAGVNVGPRRPTISCPQVSGLLQPTQIFFLNSVPPKRCTNSVLFILGDAFLKCGDAIVYSDLILVL